MRFYDIRGRHRRPLRSGASGRRPRKTCVTSVDYEHVGELLGNSLDLIVSDKSDACAAGGVIVYGENVIGACGRIFARYNRNRDIASRLFVESRSVFEGDRDLASRATLRFTGSGRI